MDFWQLKKKDNKMQNILKSRWKEIHLGPASTPHACTLFLHLNSLQIIS